MLDGAITPEVIARTAPLGVDGYVLGTQALFGKGEEYQTIFGRLRKCWGEDAAQRGGA
jgi:ribulose-phosphate 3-epimerase